MTILSTFLATSHLVSEVVLFVEKNITNVGPTDHKEHVPEIIIIKGRNLF